MKITEIKIKGFKRFTDLTVTGLPLTAKLVVLIGPNGCGKSSLFDLIYSQRKTISYSSYMDYFMRDESNHQNLTDALSSVTFYPPLDNDNRRKSVYVRTAHRNSPSFAFSGLSKVGSAIEENRVFRMIDNDAAIEKNYQRLVSHAIEDAFENNPGNQTLDEFRDETIGSTRETLKKLFPKLVLNSLGNPLNEGATFRFTKGEAKKYKFENLSGGEKATFDLILDLIIKTKEFNDTIFCIDEPEAHINARIHGNLLRVLYDLIPDNCQLWVATHSAGMMREAYDIQKESPEKVAFLDFGGRDFDEPQIITPSEMTRPLWEKIHEVALGDLADLVAPETLCLCESGKGFDAKCYEVIFSDEHPLVKFISVGSKTDVENLYKIFALTMPKSKLKAVRDRDQMRPEEARELNEQGISVLSRQCIEEYLLDDEVLQAFCKEYFPENGDILAELVQKKANTETPKQSAQEVLNCAKRHDKSLPLGEKWENFLCYTLAPLIKPHMEVYKLLESDIFGDANANP